MAIQAYSDASSSAILGSAVSVHGSLSDHTAAGGSSLRIGDPVALVPGYSPSTVNWYDAYHVVHEDIVVDIWPITRAVLAITGFQIWAELHKPLPSSASEVDTPVNG